MKKDKKDNISFKDALHINLRAIAVFYKLYPQVVISRLFYCSWQALTPYVGIWFSAEILTELMTGVVENGTATKLAGRGYTAAGKTGTAEHGDVSVTTPHSWFVGFSNVEDPDLVVCVVAEEAGAGSEVAVPIAGRIFDAYYASR